MENSFIGEIFFQLNQDELEKFFFSFLLQSHLNFHRERASSSGTKKVYDDDGRKLSTPREINRLKLFSPINRKLLYMLR